MQKNLETANTSVGESTADAIIALRDAVVSYREDVALRGVSLDVAKGELLAIMGPNGSGKTTILTLVNGLGKLLAGRVSVLGRDISNGCSAALRRRIGYVPQVHHIDPRMPVSVREVVMMGRYGRLGLLRRPGAADRRAVNELLNLVDMTRLADRPIGHLSGGEQQRVGPGAGARGSFVGRAHDGFGSEIQNGDHGAGAFGPPQGRADDVDGDPCPPRGRRVMRPGGADEGGADLGSRRP
ncbi:MAG: ATP-binding cassette domain-containing protein [Desulfobacterales bacterium]|nr:ATP-binding cassette domain-containing protein [Desulfobacterales bacterium]